MARNGSGTYSLPATMATSGATASSVTVNSIMNDIAQALTDSINKDGTKAFASSQSMGGNRLTSLGAATALSDAVQYAQLQKGNVNRATTVGGTVDAITLQFTPTITSLTTGMKIRWTSAGANTTTTPTINVDTLGAIVLKRNPGAAALVVGDLGASGTENEATYNGTNWVLTTTPVAATLMYDANSYIGIGGTATARLLVTGASETSAAPTDAGTKMSTLQIIGGSEGVGAGGAVAFGGFGKYFAAIKAYITDAADNSTGHLIFSTRAVTSDTSLTERVRLTQTGGLSFGSSGTAYGTSGQALKSNGNAPPSWANIGVTLLGTITTTSGASQSLSSLDLTPYKFLRLVFSGVSHNSGTTQSLSVMSQQVCGAAAASVVFSGIVDIALINGTGFAIVDAGGTNTPYAINTGLSTASTTVTVGVSGGAFDAGSVSVYGLS